MRPAAAESLVTASPWPHCSPSFLAMIRDVLRFGREAPDVLKPENAAAYSGMALGQYLDVSSSEREAQGRYG